MKSPFESTPGLLLHPNSGRMTFDLSWSRRDAETGKRMKITFKLVREDAQWIVHRARFEQRETYAPDDSDWLELLDTMERNAARGRIRQSDLDIVKKLHKDWRSTHLR